MGDCMKKDNNLTMILIVNVVVFTLVALNKKYRPFLSKISKQYIHLKHNVRKSKIEDKRELFQVIEQAKARIDDLGNLVAEAMNTYVVTQLNGYQQLVKAQTNACMEYTMPISSFIELSPNALEDLYPINTENPNIEILPVNSSIFKNLCGTIALIIALNSWGSLDLEQANYDMKGSAIEDIGDFLSNIETDDSLEIANNVEEIEKWTIERKIDAILTSNHTNETKMQQILALPDLTFEQAIQTLVNSNITSYETIFHYILSIPEIEMVRKLECLLAVSSVAYEEKFHAIMEMKDITINQKIWYAMLIPNVSFEKVWDDLCQLDGITQDQIVKGIINTDMISFATLFNQILQWDGISSEQLTDYLIYYQMQTSYNSVKEDEMIKYVLNLACFTKEEQLDCIWAILCKLSVNNRIQQILSFYNMTYEDYLNLYKAQDNLTEEQSIVWNLMERVNLEKEKYILEHYPFDSKKQLDSVISGCAAEGANSYADLYWVANTFFNRITNSTYVELYGKNPYTQFIADEQFAVYGSESYLLYLYPSNSLYETKYQLARQAFYDMFYGAYDAVVHNYVEFRSWDTKEFSDVYIVNKGNRYGTPVNLDLQVQYEELYKENADDTNYEWVKKLGL